MPDHPTTDQSTDRATLDRSLARVAWRLRARRVMAGLSGAICCLLGAILLHQAVLAAMPSVALVEALRVALVIGVVLALAWFGIRVARPVSASDAATAADQAADLKDELKSAYWFSRHQVGDAERAGTALIDTGLVALLLQRANHRAESLDAHRVVPSLVPRGLSAALVMALLAAGMAWWSPQGTQPSGASAQGIVQAQSASKATARAESENTASATNPQPPSTGEQALAAPAATPARPGEVDWSALERIAESLGQSERARSLKRAIQARDARRAAELIEQAKRETGAQSSDDGAFAQVARPARQRTGQADTDAGRDLVSSLGDLFRAKVNQEGLDADKSVENDLQRAMEAARQRAEQSDQPSPPTTRGNPDNTNPARPRPEGRDDGGARINGQNEGNNPGGNSNVAEGNGNHVSMSAQAQGRTPADAEQSKSPNDLAAAPVEGPKTTPPQTQLQRVRIDGQQSGADNNEGAEERLYAATRAQKSRFDYQAAASQPRYAKEAATAGERVPLAHRAVVRDYFLNLRRAEK